MKEKSKKVKGKIKTTFSDFKKFVSKGNVLDLAVGVVIGSAFSAIVNSVVNILLSLCTWAVPGGVNGLVTVLPAKNETQQGLLPGLIGQSFDKNNLQSLAEQYATQLYGSKPDGVLIESTKNTILSKYTLYGSNYVYNLSSIINWGAVINAVISFAIIAIVLFIIIKVAAGIDKANKEAEEKIREQYYKKHPDERPAPVITGKPEPTTTELLTEIRDLLAFNANKTKQENGNK